MAGYLQAVGVPAAANARNRVTHDQIIRLYQLAAVETGDEMMGLWSRPIRPSALKLLCTSVRHTSSLSTSLNRFTAFWNLLLDDYSLSQESGEDSQRIILAARGDEALNRFGNMLMLKLAHGVTSWLAGRELPLRDVCLAFERPDFAEDYPVLFPAQIQFECAQSSITFEGQLADMPLARSEADMQEFLVRALRDWIFTTFRERALSLQLREMLLQSDQLDLKLGDAA